MSFQNSDDPAFADPVRRLIRDALTASGLPRKAHLAAEPARSVLRPIGTLPGGAQIIRVDAIPHPQASFHVGIVGRQAFHLTQSPASFTAMMRASRVHVTDPETALAIARSFVDATRSMRRSARIVTGIGDITATAPAHDQAAIARLQAALAEPSTQTGGEGFRVNVFVLEDAAIERRVLTVSGDGDVHQQAGTTAFQIPRAATSGDPAPQIRNSGWSLFFYL